ncbi:GAF domain-containing protein [Acaryochloris sp. IP29b_bin.137]|uniref:GAF domain-containing protein n=1 Tax=Acaryochloris sp. IP29b_bin.137 TaxID=2969217 RepID=UPI0026324471|nr:GAF domain-containing protein [Acaryochloris sp. IP29b_bin.137]
MKTSLQALPSKADLSPSTAAASEVSSSSQPFNAGLWAKVMALTIASMLPILAIGTATYYFGSQSITRNAIESRRTGEQTLTAIRADEQQQIRLLIALLVGTGGLAVCTGVVVAYLAYRSMHSTLDVTVPQVEQDTQKAMTAQIQSLTTAFQSINTTLNRDDIFSTTVTDIRKILGVDRVIIYGLNDDDLEVVIAESVGPTWPKAFGAIIPDPCFKTRYIEKYRKGRIKAIENIDEAGLSPCYIEQLEQLAVRALLVAPITNGEQLVGLLIAHHCSGPRPWQPFEVHWFKQIATQVGFAFGKVKLQEEHNNLQQQSITQVRWMQFFTKTIQNLRSATDATGIYKVAVQNIRQFLNIDRVIVYGLDENSREVVIAESIGVGWPAAMGVTIHDPCFQARYIEKYQNGRIKAIDNIYEANLSPCYIEQLETLKVKALVVAPIATEGKLVGLLIGHQCYSPRTWQDFEVQGFAQIATQVGFALDHINAPNNGSAAPEDTTVSEVYQTDEDTVYPISEWDE